MPSTLYLTPCTEIYAINLQRDCQHNYFVAAVTRDAIEGGPKGALRDWEIAERAKDLQRYAASLFLRQAGVRGIFD